MRFVQMLGTLSAFVLSVAAASSALAQAKTYEVTEGTVQFKSEAPLETFTGTNKLLSGIITVDAAKPTEAKAEIKMKATGFKTNIALRDEHLQSENWFDAKKYPEATFRITKVSGITALKEGELAEATVAGTLELHGKTQPVTAKAKVRLSQGVLRILASFPVKLEDHNISIPSIVALKVAPIVTANVDIKAKAK